MRTIHPHIDLYRLTYCTLCSYSCLISRSETSKISFPRSSKVILGHLRSTRVTYLWLFMTTVDVFLYLFVKYRFPKLSRVPNKWPVSTNNDPLWIRCNMIPQQSFEGLYFRGIVLSTRWFARGFLNFRRVGLRFIIQSNDNHSDRQFLENYDSSSILYQSPMVRILEIKPDSAYKPAHDSTYSILPYL